MGRPFPLQRAISAAVSGDNLYQCYTLAVVPKSLTGTLKHSTE